MAPRKPRQPAKDSTTIPPKRARPVTRQMAENNYQEEEIAKMMSNKNFISKAKFEEMVGQLCKHKKFTRVQLVKMRKTVNDQAEHLLNTLVKMNQDDYGWFDFNDLEKILQDKKLIGRDKYALVAELCSAFTPTNYRKCMNFLTSKQSFM